MPRIDEANLLLPVIGHDAVRVVTYIAIKTFRLWPSEPFILYVAMFDFVTLIFGHPLVVVRIFLGH